MTQNSWQSGSEVPDTTQDEVLLAAVNKIRASIKEFSNETTCFISDVPLPDITIEPHIFCTVCPVTATFEGEEVDGGGQFKVVEAAMLQVSVFSAFRTDRLDRNVRELTDLAKGLLKFKRDVLRCFAGKNLYHRQIPDRPLLIEHMKPTRSMHPPSRQHEDDYAGFSLTFTTKFNWDLSE